jgi:D-alanine-D-alanine ligase
MKIAIVYNRDSRNVINLFGMANREKIGLKTIQRLADALRKGGHQVTAFEGDKDLVDRLEEFMPRVVQGERPGMVFNVSYGLQGQARYTHVPSILEMVGIPYVASGPMGHSLSLDKVVTKMILRQNGLPTPDFTVLQSPDSPVPELAYPMIVKPRNEAVSFGLKVVANEKELRGAARVIFEEFRQPVLVEQFIEGREINVGVLGNSPPEAFVPVELGFGKGGPAIYTYEDKTGRSGRKIEHICPAPIGAELTGRAQEIAVGAFQALGLADCARVDMRLDSGGNLYILETNSLPSLGEHGSYLVGAAHAGLDFTAFVNRLVEVASARYFGTPEPPVLDPKRVDTRTHAVSFVTQRRELMEKRLREWVNLASRTADPIGIQQAVGRASSLFEDLGMKRVPELTDEPHAFTWVTRSGLDGGTLFIAHLDVPVEAAAPHQPFRRDPEWLYGEGVGTSRASLVALEFALRGLRSIRRLRRLPVGVLLYADEGRDARYSAATIRAAAARARRVIVLRPGTVGDGVILQRRGNRRFQLRVVGEALTPGRAGKRTAALPWTMEKLGSLSHIGSPRRRVSVSVLDVKTERYAMRLPHRVSATLLLTYPDSKAGDQAEERIRTILGRKGPRWELVREADRPPMTERPLGARFLKTLGAVAQEHGIQLVRELGLGLGGRADPGEGGLRLRHGPVGPRPRHPERGGPEDQPRAAHADPGGLPGPGAEAVGPGIRSRGRAGRRGSSPAARRGARPRRAAQPGRTRARRDRASGSSPPGSRGGAASRGVASRSLPRRGGSGRPGRARSRMPRRCGPRDARGARRRSWHRRRSPGRTAAGGCPGREPRAGEWPP